jgi:hypothetical protein
LKEKALDRTVWRARFGRGFGPVVRQTAKWRNDCIKLPKSIYHTLLIVITLYNMCTYWKKTKNLEPSVLTFILLMWRIWWAPHNASKWQIGFNSALTKT